MSNTDQAPEPSMEEILSSIRRIISDDGETPAADETAAAEAEVKPVEPETPVEAGVEEAPVDEMVEPEPEPEPEPEVAMEIEAETETETVEEAPEPAPETAAAEEDDDDIFELTNVVEVEEMPAPENSADDTLDMADFGVELADSGADIEDDIDFVDVSKEEPETPEIMALPKLGPEPVLPAELPGESNITDRLVSEGVGVAAAASFGDLANTLLSRGDNATTVEELVQEMLRPLLKDWLDVNLPVLVEKLVSEEIERIARRGR